MKLNAKFYPKTVVYRKWMIIAAALVMVTMLIFFMVNISAQKKPKEVPDPLSSPSQGTTILVSPQDYGWVDQESQGPSVVAPTPPSSKETPKGNSSTLEAKGPSMENAPLVESETQTEQQPKNYSDPEPRQISQEEQNKLKAMQTPINSNQLTAAVNNNDHLEYPAQKTGTSGDNSGSIGLNSADDPNMQGEKDAFLSKSKSDEGVYLDKSMIKPRSPYEVQAGTIIPGILISGIDSDLPGQIVGQIRQNVFDSITGDHVLIPQGAKVIGLYDSKVAYGQSRVLIVWKRIIYPDGDSIDLSGMPGVDMSGYAGVTDQVNNHYKKIFGSVLLLSSMSAGAQLSQPQNNNDDNNYPTVGQTMAQSLGTNISDFGTKMADKNLNIQPTLIIRPGFLFNISVTKDIVFPGSYESTQG